MGSKIRILFLASNPDDKTKLRLGREYDLVRDSLLRGKSRNRFRLLEPVLAARPSSFSSALLTERPHVVHFCGHGSREQGIVFEDEDGYSRPAGAQELVALFEALGCNARLIFLNACYTQAQAQTLRRLFDYTVGTGGPILDSVAANFAGSFYRALADGATARGALQAGRTAINDSAGEIVVLTKRKGADDSHPFITQVLGRARVGAIAPAAPPRDSPANGGGSINNIIQGRARVGKIISITGGKLRLGGDIPAKSIASDDTDE